MSDDAILAALATIEGHLVAALNLADTAGESLIAARIQEAYASVSDRRERIMHSR